MRAFLAVLLSGMLMITALSGCNSNNNEDDLLVVVSILPLAEFAEQVGGDHVTVSTMIPKGADPHTFDPAPSQMVQLEKASLYVEVGAGLEFEIAYMDKIIAMNKDMYIVDSSKGLDLLEASEHHHHHHDGDDDEDEDEEEHEHEHEWSTNPHIWLSPEYAQVMVQNICDGLCSVDPDHASDYKNNAASYIKDLEKLDTDIHDALKDVKNRVFMCLHPQWEYFALDYDLTQIAIEVDGKEPSAQQLAELIDEAKEHSIKVVFTSPQFSTASAKAIAQEIKGQVVGIDSLDKDYINNMRSILKSMKAAME